MRPVVPCRCSCICFDLSALLSFSMSIMAGQWLHPSDAVSKDRGWFARANRRWSRMLWQEDWSPFFCWVRALLLHDNGRWWQSLSAALAVYSSSNSRKLPCWPPPCSEKRADAGECICVLWRPSANNHSLPQREHHRLHRHHPAYDHQHHHRRHHE